MQNSHGPWSSGPRVLGSSDPRVLGPRVPGSSVHGVPLWNTVVVDAMSECFFHINFSNTICNYFSCASSVGKGNQYLVVRLTHPESISVYCGDVIAITSWAPDVVNPPEVFAKLRKLS